LFHPKLELQSLCHKTKQKQTNKQTKTYSYWFDVNDILSQEQKKKIIDVTPFKKWTSNLVLNGMRK